MIYLTVLESLKIVLDCWSLIITAKCRDKLVFTFPRFAPSQWGIGKRKQAFGFHTGEHGRLLLEQWMAARQHSSSGQSTSSQGTFHCSRLHRSSLIGSDQWGHFLGSRLQWWCLSRHCIRGIRGGEIRDLHYRKKIVHRLIVLKFSLGCFQSKATI